MKEMESQIKDALGALVGLKLSIAGHAGDMREFGFGQLRARGKAMIGEYSLHLQCPWRITKGQRLITGSSDWYFPKAQDDFAKIADESWDPAKGGSVQEASLGKIFGSARTASGYMTNETSDLVVVDLTADGMGGFSLLLTPDYALTAFPSASTGEYWRLFRPGSETHFVAEGGLLYQ